jgi:hypothetical protein
MHFIYALINSKRHRYSALLYKMKGSGFCVQGFITANIEPRPGVVNVEYRRNEVYLFYEKRLSEAKPSFDIQYSKFCGSAVRFSIP